MKRIFLYIAMIVILVVPMELTAQTKGGSRKPGTSVAKPKPAQSTKTQPKPQSNSISKKNLKPRQNLDSKPKSDSRNGNNIPHLTEKQRNEALETLDWAIQILGKLPDSSPFRRLRRIDNVKNYLSGNSILSKIDDVNYAVKCLNNKVFYEDSSSTTVLKNIVLQIIGILRNVREQLRPFASDYIDTEQSSTISQQENVEKQQRQRELQEKERQRIAERDRIIQNLISNMVYVEGGTFTMGAAKEQSKDEWDNEMPKHKVTLSSYYIGKYEVTQEEWIAVMGSNPSYFSGDLRRPVEQISWDDCQQFINKLNALTGKHFRLPTEAEWEYAARGGKRSKGVKYSGSKKIENIAWYSANSNSITHSVGTKASNELGLFDMSGNVCEWCNDWYADKYYAESPSVNPSGPNRGLIWVIRGGSWDSSSFNCRVSWRTFYAPQYSPSNTIGLRLAMTI